MAISSIGVGSQLDLSTLLDNLQKAEETKLTALTKKATVHTTKLSAYGLLQGALASFQNAASALGTASLYLCLVGMFNMFFDSGVAHEVQVRWDINMR